MTVNDGVLHGNPDYELPIASEDILGGIKVGDNLTIDEDGKLNGNPDYQLPCATATQLGGIKVGDYLSVNNDCKLSPDIMGGATESGDGDPGIVPQPLSDSKDYIKVLRGDGSWVRICHTQTDAPINPKDGTLWFDTSVMELYVYVEGQSAWFQANGPACCGDGGGGSGGGGAGFDSGWVEIPQNNDQGGGQSFAFDHGLGTDKLIGAIYYRDNEISMDSVGTSFDFGSNEALNARLSISDTQAWQLEAFVELGKDGYTTHEGSSPWKPFLDPTYIRLILLAA